MTDKNRYWLKQAQDFIMIILGLVCYAFAFTAFVLPEKIVTGGVTGLSSLLFFGFHWNLAVCYYGINILFLVIAFRSVGKQFTLRTIFGATVMTILIALLQPHFPEPIVKQQTFMNIIIAGILCGIGIGIVFSHNGSTAGTDILAAMATKHTTLSFGRTMLYVDMVIISSSYFIFHSIDKVIYGLIFMVICSLTTDMVINRNRQSVQFFIISKKWQQIANAVVSEARRGCTTIDGTGWYSKQPVTILLVVCRRYESGMLQRIIKAIDPKAFISQMNVNSVYGVGFDEMKVHLGSSQAKQLQEAGEHPDIPADKALTEK